MLNYDLIRFQEKLYDLRRNYELREYFKRKIIKFGILHLILKDCPYLRLLYLSII